MNLLEQSIVLEKVYDFSDLETKKNLVKYAQKHEFINCDNSMLKIINLVQNRNSTKKPIPGFLCMWQGWLKKFEKIIFHQEYLINPLSFYATMDRIAPNIVFFSQREPGV